MVMVAVHRLRHFLLHRGAPEDPHMPLHRVRILLLNQRIIMQGICHIIVAAIIQAQLVALPIEAIGMVRT